MKQLIRFTLLLFLLNYHAIEAQESKPTWALLNFVKTDSINPILSPDKKQTFICPVSKKELSWE